MYVSQNSRTVFQAYIKVSYLTPENHLISSHIFLKRMALPAPKTRLHLQALLIYTQKFNVIVFQNYADTRIKR